MGEPTALDWVRELTAIGCDHSGGFCWVCGEERPCTRERARRWMAQEEARQARAVLEPHRETLARLADE